MLLIPNENESYKPTCVPEILIKGFKAVVEQMLKTLIEKRTSVKNQFGFLKTKVRNVCS